MARSEQVMIRLSPEVKAKFADISRQRGMSVSAMAAYLIGTFVQQEESRHGDSRRSEAENSKS